MTNEQLTALRKAAEEATPGPWHQVGHPWNPKGDFVCAGSEDPHIGKYVADTEDFDGEVENSFMNARHISLANPAAILSMLDHVERLEKDAARYRWLRQYLISDNTTFDDDIVGCYSEPEMDTAIDAAMGEQK